MAETSLKEALRLIAAKQPETLAMIERNGFVFDSIGREPGNWQHLAFSIYVDPCEMDMIARQALGIPIGGDPLPQKGDAHDP